jgi:uncharacterized protein YnzC (UPF0291/DUF896 family)
MRSFKSIDKPVMEEDDERRRIREEFTNGFRRYVRDRIADEIKLITSEGDDISKAIVKKYWNKSLKFEKIWHMKSPDRSNERHGGKSPSRPEEKLSKIFDMNSKSSSSNDS